MAEPGLYGLMARFSDPSALLAAARRAHEAGYRELDAFSPFPIEGLYEALGHGPDGVAPIVLVSALVGGAAGYLMQVIGMALAYPLNVGGRPLVSWPAFIPVTFELTVLLGAFGAVGALLSLNGLPRPYHPVFNVPAFQGASLDGYFLCLKARDPRFEPGEALRFLESLSPLEVADVVR